MVPYVIYIMVAAVHVSKVYLRHASVSSRANTPLFICLFPHPDTNRYTLAIADVIRPTKHRINKLRLTVAPVIKKLSRFIVWESRWPNG